MVSSVKIAKEKFHASFIASPRFAPELARVPYRWRKRLINIALSKMAWSHHYKIYEGIARDTVREFINKYIPDGANLALDDSDICALAEKAAGHVSVALWGAQSDMHARQVIDCECAEYSVDAPTKNGKPFEKLSDVIGRAIDPRWWRRQLRKVYGRAREGGAIKLGMVHYRGEPYASNDSVLERIAQNRRNALALEAVTMENEHGQQFTLAKLAEKGTSNKSIRRGELMLRINGFETIAKENGDQGIFITWTCPSKYHARIKGGAGGGAPNPKYAGLDPREANQYLGRVTALARSALARRGIGLYGFRIAEPHHDGCPHWHMLLFVRPMTSYKTGHIQDIAGRAIRVMKRYAWREDRGESGAFKYRLDAKRIDWSKGSAAGYIAKYVAKNIDGAHVGEHKTIEGYTVQTDKDGDAYLTPSARVETWAARWGIRQFQQWGGAPVTVWRELRRIKADMVKNAPPSMAQAWQAVQKIDGEKRADWAQYLKAQGGAIVARKDLVITLAKDEKTVVGRYGEAVRIMPYGVHCADLAGVVYASVRHVWRQVERAGVAVAVAVDFAVTRTRVNNCTQVQEQEQSDVVRVRVPLVEPVLSIDAKQAVLHQWAVLGACPYPRLQM